jgi:pyruvate formate-lyase/glycerol dehydratase family glycyl radical enzyme
MPIERRANHMATNLALSQLEAHPPETRGQKLWAEIRERRDTEPVSLERAKLITASHKETQGLPMPMRRANAFEKIVTEIPIYIDDGQLLAGDFGSRPMAAEWSPEFTVEWILKELKDDTLPYKLRKEELNTLKEICAYWKDFAFKESFFRYLGTEEMKKLFTYNENGSWVFAASVEAQTEKGWYVPDYPKAIRLGFLGIIAEAEAELSKTRALDDQSLAKIMFLEALVIMLKAGIRYGKRYAALARDLAKGAEGQRRQDLERIAAVCDWVPENPARTFHEALQTMWFCHVLIFWDLRGVGVSPGRVDQYLYPYYKKDLEEGKISREEAIELLECFRVKMSEVRNFHTGFVREGTSGETQFHNCTLGGQTPDGKDATNELSFLWLEAAMRTRTTHPTLSVRWHENLSPEFAMKGAELCKLGLGYPAWFGDKAAIQYLVNMGAPLEEARDYALAGCVLHVIPHKTAATWPTVVNIPKIFEITLHNGVDPALGKQVGLKTGDFDSLETYEALRDAFKKQVRYFLSYSTNYLNKVRLFRAANLPDIFISAFFDDCIKRGQSVVGGGAHYQYGSMYMLPIGVVDVADSLAAIKKYIYEEGSLTKKDLMQALAVNFDGKEEIRQRLLSAPKYGNDEDGADYIVRDLYDWLCEIVGEIDAPFGTKYVPAPHNLSFHGAMGKRVGALPSGRLAGVSLADGAVSPAQGSDRKGPTAVINSAGKVNHTPLFGTLFNMKFHPNSLKTKEDLSKFLTLIRTYFDNYKGKHIQFNVMDRKTLLDAQARPENYRNLIIRVAGYSALWVELDRKIQDEVIARTEQTF